MGADRLATAGWVLILAYMAVILTFVVRGARRNRSLADYALGSVHFSPVAVGLALAASMTSAATFIINPGFIALYGVSGVISYALALPAAAILSLVVLTKGFRRHGTQVKALTMAQWMGSRYESRGMALMFALLSLLLVTFVVLIVVGLTKVLASTLDVGELPVLIGVTAFVFGYMMFGGANSMVYTNTVQAVLMLVVAVILLTSGLEHFRDGVHGFLDQLRAVDPALARPTNPGSFLFRDWFEIIVTQMIVGVAIVCQPHIITKSLLLKTDREVNRYLWVGGTTEMIFFLVVIVGLYARLAMPDLTVDGAALKMDGIVSAYVVREFPVAVGLLVVLGLLSAGLSTLEGLIQSLATTVTKDLVEPLGGAQLPADGDARERRLLAVNRGAIALLAVVAAWLSWDQLRNPRLSVAIFAQNGVYAYFSAAFVPILLGMFRKERALAPAAAAAVTAVIVHFSMSYGRVQLPGTAAAGDNPGVAAATAIIASVLAALAVHLLSGRGRHARA
ncbi:sodium:solute symporter [bacterium]|nr:sodium:solute symporter [bacterium]HPF34809.1 sodium:solute symporter [Candidatus Krumholzibacteria bacterium]